MDEYLFTGYRFHLRYRIDEAVPSAWEIGQPLLFQKGESGKIQLFGLGGKEQSQKPFEKLMQQFLECPIVVDIVLLIFILIRQNSSKTRKRPVSFFFSIVTFLCKKVKGEFNVEW